jgi:hypothetical protein
VIFTAVGLERMHNLDVTARLLLNGDLRFRALCDFNELRVANALEFPDGKVVLLTLLCEGQHATVLQLPAEPKTAIESEVERRAHYVGLPV